VVVVEAVVVVVVVVHASHIFGQLMLSEGPKNRSAQSSSTKSTHDCASSRPEHDGNVVIVDVAVEVAVFVAVDVAEEVALVIKVVVGVVSSHCEWPWCAQVAGHVAFSFKASATQNAFTSANPTS